MGGEIDEYVAGGAWDCALVMPVQGDNKRDSMITGRAVISV
jgi:hypothetical protein